MTGLVEVREPEVWHGRILTQAIALFAAKIWRWNADRHGQRPLLSRFAAHLAVFLVALLIWGGGSLHFSAPLGVSSEAANSLETHPLIGQATSSHGATTSTRAYYRASSSGLIPRQPKPHTAIPDRPRLEVVIYQVQPGDTTESIAEDFALQPTTIMWSNPSLEKSPDLLKLGQELFILPLDGVYHTVAEGDTLEALAEDYKVSVRDITGCQFNKLPAAGELAVGSRVIVPNGTKPYERQQVTAYTGVVSEEIVGAGIFSWPVSGWLSQGYWWGHRAIDIANNVGTAIKAADAGYVSFAGWTDIGYGYLVVIDHANGYQTYYAHLSDFYIATGQTVYTGQVIGALGSTGNSTGPHLHFEIRYNQYPTNPLIYLP
ncbi:MAG TPA: peptidoglycan DD-metalloendopeptidase family protein [Thermoflexia bacterium]|nr:peptidoglycan DD-metalloendopeptidase family protein [Thermoflexia bacterium]